MPDHVSELAKDVLDILACPACPDRPRLEAEEGDTAFRCPTCKRRFPIVGGIPQLLVEDAVTATDDDK